MDNLSILIIDDNENNLFTLEYILKQVEDINIHKAANGVEGLDILSREKVHLIIVDVQMPEMNGFEFCNKLKESDAHKDIPFIFLTAYFKSEEFEARGYKVGAFDYLTKPVDEHRLLNKVRLYNSLYLKNEKLRSENTELRKENQLLRDGKAS